MAGWLEEYNETPEHESVKTTEGLPTTFIARITARAGGAGHEYGYVQIYVGINSGSLAYGSDCDWTIAGDDLQWSGIGNDISGFSHGDTVYWAAYYSANDIDYFIGTDVYNFTLASPPNKPIKPTPTHETSGIKLSWPTLSWKAG